MRRLHHFPLSPFSRKVRLVLAEKKLAFESIAERPWEPSPGTGVLPALIELNGRQLSDARAITEYLEETAGQAPLLPKDPFDRATIRGLVNHFDDNFAGEVTSVILHERVFKRFTPSDDRDPDLHRLKASLSAMREHLQLIGGLADQNGYLAGTLSLADITAAAHLSCLDYFGDVPWRSFPIVREWYARLKSRPSFRQLLMDNLPGFSPAPHYANLDF